MHETGLPQGSLKIVQGMGAGAHNGPNVAPPVLVETNGSSSWRLGIQCLSPCYRVRCMLFSLYAFRATGRWHPHYQLCKPDMLSFACLR